MSTSSGDEEEILNEVNTSPLSSPHNSLPDLLLYNDGSSFANDDPHEVIRPRPLNSSGYVISIPKEVSEGFRRSKRRLQLQDTILPPPKYIAVETNIDIEGFYGVNNNILLGPKFENIQITLRRQHARGVRTFTNNVLLVPKVVADSRPVLLRNHMRMIADKRKTPIDYSRMFIHKMNCLTSLDGEYQTYHMLLVCFSIKHSELFFDDVVMRKILRLITPYDISRGCMQAIVTYELDLSYYGIPHSINSSFKIHYAVSVGFHHREHGIYDITVRLSSGVMN
jgi:hypothetical protein